MSDARTVKEALRERVEELAQFLFPSGKREGVHWCVGNVTGAPGKSFKICIAGDKAGLWGDFADSRKHSRSLLDLWMQARNVDFTRALHEAAQWTQQPLNGSAPTTQRWSGNDKNARPINWQRCVDALSENDLERLGNQRWFSRAFCSWLHKRGLMGLWQKCIAFPIIDRTGTVIRAHVRESDSWVCEPKSKKESLHPLVVGDLANATEIHTSESQWDVFAVADRTDFYLDENKAFVATRGAQNAKLLRDLPLREDVEFYAWPQNDAAGWKWFKDVRAIVPGARQVVPPAKFKDPNAWTSASPDDGGAFKADLLRAIEDVGKEQRLTVLTLAEILALPIDEHSCMLGDQLLAKGQSLVIAGQPGLGKSRLALQLAVTCITGRSWCGIETHARGLRWLVLQSENGAERLKADCAALLKWGGDFDQLLLRIQVIRSDNDGFLCLADPEAVARIDATIQHIKPDGIIADPLRDFGIGDLNSDADMIATLRELSRIVRHGNPDRALVLLHHALTGRAGAAKAFGFERAGFARNSKALLGWARAQINVIPGAEESNEQLVLTCGKNSNGKEFPPIAVRLNSETMIYEPDEDFDMEGWRVEVATAKSSRVQPQILRELLGKSREYDRQEIVAVIREETGVQKTRAYELVRQAQGRGILRFNKISKIYALA